MNKGEKSRMDVYRGTYYHVSKHRFNGMIYYCVASNEETGVIYISRSLDDAINRLKEVEKTTNNI